MTGTSRSAGDHSACYALIIGIGEYRDPRIPRLNFTHADAQAFRDVLVDKRHAGFPEENIKLLVDEQATKFNIRHEITHWLFQAPEESTVMIYFAGHGGQESDKTRTEPDGIAKYLLPWDANIDNLFASALSNTEFQRDMSTISASRLVIFMDACYAAGVTQGGARDVGIVESPFNRLAEGRGRLVIASAQPNQRSWEDPKVGHGIFTHHLLEALKGKADQEGDGYVSILEVYKYLEREVPRSVRALANSVQEPLMRGDVSRDIILTTDTQRIEELARQRNDAARRQREELLEKQRRLLELYGNRELPRDAYLQASELVEKELGEISSQEEQTLVDNLEAMLRGGISTRVYLANRASILSEREKSAGPPPPNVPPENLPDGTTRSTPNATGAAETTQSGPKYCFRCGTPTNPQNKFCNGCGRQIRP